VRVYGIQFVVDRSNLIFNRFPIFYSAQHFQKFYWVFYQNTSTRACMVYVNVGDSIDGTVRF
jgi:hypothetical protein